MTLYKVQARIERPHVSGPARAQLCRVSAPQRPRVVMSLGGAAPSVPAPVNLSPPVVSGLVRIGETLTATLGVWSDATGWARQWTRDGVAIGGETGSTYVAVAADIAALIGCEVTATGPGGVSSPVASTTVSSPWQPILAAKPGVLIWDGRDPYCYGGAAVGSPVTTLYTIDGVLLGTQGVTAARATRLASGRLKPDGTDDYHPIDAHASIFDGTHTLVAGWSNPAASGTRNLITAATATSLSATLQMRLTYVSSGTTGTRRVYYQDASTLAQVSLTSLGADADLMIRAGAPGAAIGVDELTSPLTAVGSATRYPTTVTHTLATLFATRRNVAPLIGDHWEGELRHIALHVGVWSDSEALLYRACAIAAGVM